MTVAATANTATNSSSSSTNSSSTNTSLAALGSDITQFLKLLTTQLQNQDPLNPTDNAEMTSQLIGYASVQQGAATNTKLDKLISLQQSSTAANGLSYIGKQIEANGNQVVLSSGSAKVMYNLADTADNVSLSLVNSAGKTVATFSGDTSEGDHTFSWDGTDNYGNQLPDGVYTLNISATGADATTVIQASPRTTGTVTGVDMSSGDVLLNLGSTSVKMSDVVSIQ